MNLPTTSALLTWITFMPLLGAVLHLLRMAGLLVLLLYAAAE